MSADGTRIVTGSHDQTARVWDAPTGQQLVELKGHSATVTGVALSADGTQIVTTSDDRTVRVWDGHADRPLVELKGHTKEVTSASVSADGTRVVTTDGGVTFVWDTATGERVSGEPIPPPAPTGNCTPDGKYVFTPSGDRVLKVPLQIDSDERLRRLWLTHPDPNWHTQRQKELLGEGNVYGAAIQRWAEHNARGTLALEAGDLEAARGHFIIAAALKPQPPAPPPIVPPPPATIPLAE
jgi:hypothetical protein